MSERISRRVAAVVVIAVLAGVGVAGTTPAVAFMDPAVLTITPGDATAENLGGITFAGECLPGSDAAQLRWDIGSSPVVLPVVLDGAGAFSGLGPYFTGAAPGLGLAVTLDCLQGGSSIGASYAFAMYPDLGASINGPTTVPLDAAFSPSYDCGVPIAPSSFASASITLYDPHDAPLDTVGGLPVPTGSDGSLGTPASYGLVVGDTVALYLNCLVTTGGSATVAGFRSYSVTIAPGTTPPVPSTDPSPAVTASPTVASDSSSVGPSELAETGTDALRASGIAALAAALLLGGVVVRFASRGRARGDQQ